VLDTSTTGLGTTANLPEGKYYWRVRAKNSLNVYGRWSPVRSFTIDW